MRFAIGLPWTSADTFRRSLSRPLAGFLSNQFFSENSLR